MKKTLTVLLLISYSILSFGQKDKTTADAYKYINGNNKLIETLQDYGYNVKSISDLKISQEPSDKNKFYKVQTSKFKKIVNSRIAYLAYKNIKDKGSMNFYCTFKVDGIDYKAPFSIDWYRVSYDYNYKLNSDDVQVLNEWTKPRYYFRPTNITSKNQPKVSEQYRINSCLDYLEGLKEGDFLVLGKVTIY